MSKSKTYMSLLALDTEGEWNRPLLENAADISGAGCVFASSKKGIDEALDGFQHVIACETGRDSVSVYDFPAPRGKVAVIVGNEERGIPRSVLKKADSIISIPMAGAGMSSVNVAVAGAIVIYALTKDLARKFKAHSPLTHRDVDILIHAPADPHELGSLLRSVWSFGWRRVFVADLHGIWFTKDHDLILESRAAARRHKNPIAVLQENQLVPEQYDHVLSCGKRRIGTPLSKLHLPQCRHLLIVCGNWESVMPCAPDSERCFIDCVNTGAEPSFRHAGSILFSMVSEMLKKG